MHSVTPIRVNKQPEQQSPETVVTRVAFGLDFVRYARQLPRPQAISRRLLLPGSPLNSPQKEQCSCIKGTHKARQRIQKAAPTRGPALPAGTSLRWNCSQDPTCSRPPLLLCRSRPPQTHYTHLKIVMQAGSFSLPSPNLSPAPGQDCSHLSGLESNRKRASTCRAA